MNRLVCLRSGLVVALSLVAGMAVAQMALANSPPDMFPTISDQWMVTLLVVTGFVLLLAEIKIISYGLLGLGGLACLSGAVLILIRRPDAFFGIPPALLIAFIVAGAVLCIVMALLGYRSQQVEISTGSESYAGQLAEVSRDLNPIGKVFFQGSYWDAVSSVPVEAGSTVRIVSFENLRFTVEPLNPAPAAGVPATVS